MAKAGVRLANQRLEPCIPAGAGRRAPPHARHTTPTVPDVSDILAIHELLALYGHIIDEREWQRVGELFTDSALYDMSAFGLGVVHGAVAIREMWSRPNATHPVAHHATNIVVSEDADGTVRVLSKGLGVGSNGRVGSAVYHDVVVRTSAGWRFAARRAQLRR